MNEFIEYEIIQVTSIYNQRTGNKGTDAISEAIGIDVAEGLLVGGITNVLFIFDAIGKDVSFTLDKFSLCFTDGKQKLMLSIRLDKSWANENPDWINRTQEYIRRRVCPTNVYIYEASVESRHCNETNY